MSTDDMDQVDEAADALEEGDDDVTSGQRTFAYGYLAVLFATIATAIGASVYLGIIDLQLSVTATLEVGHLIEWILASLTVLFIVFTAAMLYVALPGSILGSALRAGARIADAYELPGSNDQEDSSDD